MRAQGQHFPATNTTTAWKREGEEDEEEEEELAASQLLDQPVPAARPPASMKVSAESCQNPDYLSRWRLDVPLCPSARKPESCCLPQSGERWTFERYDSRGGGGKVERTTHTVFHHLHILFSAETKRKDLLLLTWLSEHSAGNTSL